MLPTLFLSVFIFDIILLNFHFFFLWKELVEITSSRYRSENALAASSYLYCQPPTPQNHHSHVKTLWHHQVRSPWGAHTTYLISCLCSFLLQISESCDECGWCCGFLSPDPVWVCRECCVCSCAIISAWMVQLDSDTCLYVNAWRFRIKYYNFFQEV